MGSSMILTWESTYCPSSGELYDCDMRRRVLSIIWGAIWFWHEKARTVHHLPSYMILTWDGPYCPSLGSSIILTWEGTYSSSSVELYDFARRGHVLSIIWRATWFWDEEARAVHHLESYMILRWGGTYCPSSGDLYDLDVEGTYSPPSGELYDINHRGHVLSIIWGALWF